MSRTDIAAKLQETHNAVRSSLGDRWQGTVAELKPVIERIMSDTRDPNPVSSVIPVAKAMSAAGEDPTVLLAVAAEMSIERLRNELKNQRIPAA